MPHAASRRIARLAFLPILAVAFACSWPSPARATFHLNEINKILVGVDGDATLQAIEFKMLFNGENLINGKSINVYNGAGALVSTLGTFGADLPAGGAVAGRTFLAATMKFKQRFGITPDIQISPGIPVTSGQIAFEDIGCRVDAVAYGNVSTVLVGPTSAPPIPSTGGAVLFRVFDPGTFPSCPIADNSDQFFVLTTAGGNHPVMFTNYSGVSVNVASTATSVEAEAAAIAFRIAPNPVRGSASIESPRGGSFAVYDLRGRRVRTLRAGESRGPVRTTWDGADDRGRPLASGVYFIRQEGSGEPLVRRFVVAR